MGSPFTKCYKPREIVYNIFLIFLLKITENSSRIFCETKLFFFAKIFSQNFCEKIVFFFLFLLLLLLAKKSYKCYNPIAIRWDPFSHFSSCQKSYRCYNPIAIRWDPSSQNVTNQEKSSTTSFMLQNLDSSSQNIFFVRK